MAASSIDLGVSLLLLLEFLFLGLRRLFVEGAPMLPAEERLLEVDDLARALIARRVSRLEPDRV